MGLNILWFILIAVLYTGYFVLEGFDMGVGILLPFLGTDDRKRRVMINAIGPHWDGNEVWLVTAGGATFAAFPNWYATLFSGFYLPLVLMLLALIVRGVAFEFRSKDESKLWRSTWDWAIFFGSLIPAFLWGVAFSNFVRGVPININMIYVGGFFNLLNPFAVLSGLVVVVVFTLHGALFLILKTDGNLLESARKTVKTLWIPAVILLVGLAVFSLFEISNKAQLATISSIALVMGILSLIGAGLLGRSGKDGWAFGLTAAAILLVVISLFAGLFPNVMVSSLGVQNNLTIQNAASSPYTLRVMSIIAGILVPIVLVYQAFSYWVFRKRITEKTKRLEY